MNNRHPALFISRQQAVETQPPSPFIRVLRPRLSVDVDTLRTMDGNEIRLWMLFRDMQQGRSTSHPIRDRSLRCLAPHNQASAGG